MFEQFKELTDQISQQQANLKEVKAKERLDKFGSIHFKLKDTTLKDKDLDIEVEWNKFVGEEVTPEIIKEELDKILKALT